MSKHELFYGHPFAENLFELAQNKGSGVRLGELDAVTFESVADLVHGYGLHLWKADLPNEPILHARDLLLAMRDRGWKSESIAFGTSEQPLGAKGLAAVRFLAALCVKRREGRLIHTNYLFNEVDRRGPLDNDGEITAPTSIGMRINPILLGADDE